MSSEKGYVRHVEDRRRGRGHTWTPYDLRSGSPLALSEICPCGATIRPDDLLAGLCIDCLHQPAFIVFALPDGAKLASHPAGYKSNPLEISERREFWWYQDCQRCRQGMATETALFHSYQTYCQSCAQRYRLFRDAYRRQQVAAIPALANLFVHFQAEIERLEYPALHGRPSKNCPRRAYRPGF